MPQQQNNVWFGVSMGLGGVIVGFAIATVMTGVQLHINAVPDAVANNQPTAPTQVPSTDDKLVALAQSVGVDTGNDAFKNCYNSTTFDQHIKDDMTGGSKSGVNGTPGNILYDLKSKQGMLVSGARPVEAFEKQIDFMLANSGKKIPAPPAGSQEYQLAPAVTPIDFDTEHITGNKNATLALIEYADYQCPFCRAVHPTHQELMKKYGDKIMWVFRQFPLPATMHPNAMKFARAAECVNKAGGNDVFWKYTNAFFDGDPI